MTDRIVFESVLNQLQYGLKSYDPGTHDSTTLEAKLLEFHRQRFSAIYLTAMQYAKPSLPEIYFDYFDLGYVNGLAHVENKRGYVGIATDTVLIAYDIFYRLLSHPEFMNHVGNPTVETIHPYHSHGFSTPYADLIALRGSGDVGLSFVRPVDPIRAAYADILAAIAIDHLMHHEIGHILLGHCEFQHGNNFRTFILESAKNMIYTSNDEAMDSQAMEMDADSYALSRICHDYILNAPTERIGERKVQESKANILEPPHVILNHLEAIISDCLLAYQTLCWILGFDRPKKPLDAEDHPPIFGRFFYCRLLPKIMSPQFAKLNLDFDVDKSFRIAFTAANWRANAGYLILNSGKEDPAFDDWEQESTQQELINHLASIKAHFKTIQHKLDVVSHRGPTLRRGTD